MREYAFPLTRILPYKDLIVHPVHIRKRIQVFKNPYSDIFDAV